VSYDRLKRGGGVRGGDRCSSMARKKGGVHGAAAAREEAEALPAR
jgi:hypothetical protein